MRASAAVSQQITGSFQISGKMHGIHARWTRSRHTRVCFPRDSRKGKNRQSRLAVCSYLKQMMFGEVQMHIGSVILIIWLVIGGFAAGQRGDYKGPVNCSRAATAAVTILAGPLNYLGVNPYISCTVQHPSN
jgi:hypothetical protein